MKKKRKKKNKQKRINNLDTSLIIDQNKLNLQKEYHAINFKTGKYLTEKDRPRKKYRVQDIGEDV